MRKCWQVLIKQHPNESPKQLPLSDADWSGHILTSWTWFKFTVDLQGSRLEIFMQSSCLARLRVWEIILKLLLLLLLLWWRPCVTITWSLYQFLLLTSQELFGFGPFFPPLLLSDVWHTWLITLILTENKEVSKSGCSFETLTQQHRW